MHKKTNKEKCLPVKYTTEHNTESCDAGHRPVEGDRRGLCYSESFDEWLHSEFMRLHGLVENESIPAATAYKAIGRLMAGKAQRHSRVEHSGGVSVKIVVLDRYGEGKDGGDEECRA